MNIIVTGGDIKKIKKMIKWTPKVKFKKDVGILLENIHLWRKAPIWNKKSINQATKLWFKYL